MKVNGTWLWNRKFRNTKCKSPEKRAIETPREFLLALLQIRYQPKARKIGPFRELKIRLCDRFGFVANRPRIRWSIFVAVWRQTATNIDQRIRGRLATNPNRSQSRIFNSRNGPIFRALGW